MLPELTVEIVEKMIRDIDECIKTLENQCQASKAKKSPMLEPGQTLGMTFPNARLEIYKSAIHDLKNRKYDLEHIKKDIERNQNDDYKKRTQKRDK